MSFVQNVILNYWGFWLLFITFVFGLFSLITYYSTPENQRDKLNININALTGFLIAWPFLILFAWVMVGADKDLSRRG